MFNYEQELKQWQEYNEILKEVDSPLLFSPPDPRTRNYPLQSIAKVPAKLPQKVDWWDKVPFMMDQDKCGWCVSFAINGAMHVSLNYHNRLPKGGLSNTFLMSLCKEIDGVPNEEGTYISTGLKLANNIGNIPESDLSFKGDCKILKITEAQKKKATYKIKAYSRIYTLTEIKQALAAGKMVVMGTIVTDINWLDGDEYILLPHGQILGAHATFLVGYDNTKKHKGHTGFLRGVNSWSESFGDAGSFWMCYDYVDHKLDIGLKPFMEAWAVDMGYNLPETKPEENPIKEIITLDQSVELINGRVMVPSRFITEFNGGTIEWFGGKEQKAVVTNPSGVKATLQVGNNKVIIE